MNFKLIDGDFTPTETLDLLTQLVQVKIKFHEDKIKTSLHEEDIKMRERKIKSLQDKLAEAKNHVKSHSKNFHLNSDISIL